MPCRVFWVVSLPDKTSTTNPFRSQLPRNSSARWIRNWVRLVVSSCRSNPVIPIWEQRNQRLCCWRAFSMARWGYILGGKVRKVGSWWDVRWKGWVWKEGEVWGKHVLEAGIMYHVRVICQSLDLFDDRKQKEGHQILPLFLTQGWSYSHWSCATIYSTYFDTILYIAQLLLS